MKKLTDDERVEIIEKIVTYFADSKDDKELYQYYYDCEFNKLYDEGSDSDLLDSLKEVEKEIDISNNLNFGLAKQWDK